MSWWLGGLRRIDNIITTYFFLRNINFKSNLSLMIINVYDLIINPEAYLLAERPCVIFRMWRQAEWHTFGAANRKRRNKWVRSVGVASALMWVRCFFFFPDMFVVKPASSILQTAVSSTWKFPETQPSGMYSLGLLFTLETFGQGYLSTRVKKKTQPIEYQSQDENT